MDTAPPQRLRLTAGDDSAEVAPAAGGRLASLVIGGEQRLVTRPPADQDNPELRWGSFVMAPWAGRVADARFTWQGTDVVLPANFEGRHAIHGLATDRRWEVVRVAAQTAELRCVLADAPWPFTGCSIDQRVDLQPGRLTQSVRVIAGPEPMPAAAGWHPWFARPGHGDVAVRLDAASTLELDSGGIPTGRQQPVDAETDLRHGPALGDRRLDHAYVRPAPTARLQWPDLDLHMTFGPTITTAVVHTPPEGVCIEPQTAWPDAANLAARADTAETDDPADTATTGLVNLAAGAALTATVVWRWSAPAAQ
jgi:aldose 1-epimerase